MTSNNNDLKAPAYYLAGVAARNAMGGKVESLSLEFPNAVPRSATARPPSVNCVRCSAVPSRAVVGLPIAYNGTTRWRR